MIPLLENSFSPNNARIASTTELFPEPFSPTNKFNPFEKEISTASENILKSLIEISETSLFCLVLLQCIVEKTDQILHPIEKMQIILNEFDFKPIDILDLFSDTITRSVIEKKNWKRLMDEMLHLVFHNDKEEDSKEQMLDKY